MIQLNPNNFINGYEGTDVFNALLYGNNSNTAVQNYILNDISTIASTLTDAGKSFMSNARALYDTINSDAVKNTAAGILRAAKGIFITDSIIDYSDVSSLMAAKAAMQRFVMAHEGTRSLYQDKLINGYSDSYVDVFKSEIGESHYDYRLVMDGVPNILEDGATSIKFFSQENYSEDDALSHHQKVSVLRTWELLDYLLEESDIDYTNIFGGTRG